MILRNYQQSLAGDTRRAFSTGKNRPLICLPTGGGKTVVFSYIASNASLKGNRVWIIAHRKELIRQAGNTLAEFGVSHGVIKSGVAPSPKELVHVASVQTLVGKIGKIEAPDLIIIDEAHHAISGSYRKILDAYPLAKVIGVTATPCRLDGRGLGDVFDALILGPPLAWLTENGFLSPARYFAPPVTADLSKVKVTRGDFDAAELEAAMNKPTITGDAVTHYQRLCDGQPMLVFCVSVQHAQDVAREYRAAGYRAAHVDGNLSDEDRDDRIQGLATGKYQIITSCELIGEGLDVPVCVAAQLLRPTQSLVLHLQQIGRVLRKSEGKEYAVILDHVGNCQRHGLAADEREWSLDGKKFQKRKDDDPEIFVRSCPECFSAHKPVPECPYCGFIYPAKPRTKAEIKAGELEELLAVRKTKKLEEGMCRTFQDFLALGVARGYAAPAVWAQIRMKARGGKFSGSKKNTVLNDDIYPFKIIEMEFIDKKVKLKQEILDVMRVDLELRLQDGSLEYIEEYLYFSNNGAPRIRLLLAALGVEEGMIINFLNPRCIEYLKSKTGMVSIMKSTFSTSSGNIERNEISRYCLPSKASPLQLTNP